MDNRKEKTAASPEETAAETERFDRQEKSSSESIHPHATESKAPEKIVDERILDLVGIAYAFFHILVFFAIVWLLWLLAGWVDAQREKHAREAVTVTTYVQIETPKRQVESFTASLPRKAEKAPEPEADPAPFYEITPEEYDLIAHTIMCEVGGADPQAAMLVAQCILNACMIDGIRPAEAVDRYQYADYPTADPAAAVYGVIQDVFERGYTITNEPIMFFYSPANMPDGVSRWHETQTFVIEYGGHKYFKLNERDGV